MRKESIILLAAAFALTGCSNNHLDNTAILSPLSSAAEDASIETETDLVPWEEPTEASPVPDADAASGLSDADKLSQPEEYDAGKSFAENYSLWKEAQARPKYDPSEFFDASGYDSFDGYTPAAQEETGDADIDIEIRNDLEAAGLKDTELTDKLAAEMSLQKRLTVEAYREGIKDRVAARNELNNKLAALREFAQSKGADISQDAIPDESYTYEIDYMKANVSGLASLAGMDVDEFEASYAADPSYWNTFVEQTVQTVFSFEPAALSVIKASGSEFTQEDLDQYSDELLDAYGYENLSLQAKQYGADTIIAMAECAMAGEIILNS